MQRQIKLVGATIVVGLLILGVTYLQDRWHAPDRTPEGYNLLTPMPAAQGFEPAKLPRGPILKTVSQADVLVYFGYKVGQIPYSYELKLSFPQDSTAGHAEIAARHASRVATAQSPAVRRWDEPRKAYAVALQESFVIDPAVPALCLKAVIGAKTSGYDLRDGSLCVAQRDAAGNCHPETLACGLIRP